MRTAELHASLLTSHHFDLASDVATGAPGLGRRVKKKESGGQRSIVKTQPLCQGNTRWLKSLAMQMRPIGSVNRPHAWTAAAAAALP